MGKQFLIEVVDKPKSSGLGWLIFIGLVIWLFIRK